MQLMRLPRAKILTCDEATAIKTPMIGTDVRGGGNGMRPDRVFTPRHWL